MSYNNFRTTAHYQTSYWSNTDKDCRTLGRSNNRRVRSDWTSSFYGQQSTVKIGEKEKIFTEVRKLKSMQ